VQDSEWGAPVFMIPKKDGTVHFITDYYRQVNKLIRRKPYPLPRIASTLQELEGFQVASALDLNILGYYTICPIPGAKDLTMT
jgi:hypothetical protein